MRNSIISIFPAGEAVSVAVEMRGIALRAFSHLLQTRYAYKEMVSDRLVVRSTHTRRHTYEPTHTRTRESRAAAVARRHRQVQPRTMFHLPTVVAGRDLATAAASAASAASAFCRVTSTSTCALLTARTHRRWHRHYPFTIHPTVLSVLINHRRLITLHKNKNKKLYCPLRHIFFLISLNFFFKILLEIMKIIFDTCHTFFS